MHLISVEHVQVHGCSFWASYEDSITSEGPVTLLRVTGAVEQGSDTKITCVLRMPRT